MPCIAKTVTSSLDGTYHVKGHAAEHDGNFPHLTYLDTYGRV
ncbi:MAG: hypothetical protein ACLU6P_02745 [Roseburia intestinalis]